jgi:PleD family two-component response regulator
MSDSQISVPSFLDIQKFGQQVASAARRAQTLQGNVLIGDNAPKETLDAALCELQATLEELQVAYDSLTQIANRRWFDNQLATLWKQHQRDQAPLALTLSDIDYFKLYNDSYGHLAGARYIAATIQESLQRFGLPHRKSPLKMVTMSFGVISLVPSVNQCVDDLIEGADRALYQAKDRRRNQVAVWQPSVQPE